MLEVRIVLRQLCSRPLYVATAVASLALGVSVNAALMRSLLEVYETPSGIEAPGRLARIQIVQTEGGQPFAAVQGRDFELIGSSLSSVDAVAGFTRLPPLAVAWNNRAEESMAIGVDDNYFEVLGVTAALGRLISGTRNDDLRSVVLSYELWRSRFRSDLDIIGTTLVINTETFVVVGVAEPGFKGTDRWSDPKLVFLSVDARQLVDRARLAPKQQPGSEPAVPEPPDLDMIVRLREGRTHHELSAEVEHLIALSELPGIAQLQGRWPEPLEYRAAPLTQLAHGINGQRRRGVILLIGCGALVLLLACANLANLLIARDLEKAKDLDLRRALGASSIALVRLQLLESAAIALLAALVSAPLAALILHRVEALWPPLVARDAVRLDVDASLLLIAIALSLAAVLVFASVPALIVTRRRKFSLASTANATDSKGRPSRVPQALVVVQVALAAVILVAAALSLHSLLNLRALPLGFEPDRLLMFGYDFSRAGEDEESATVIRARLLESARANPQVESASYSTTFFGATWFTNVVPEGWEPTNRIGVSINAVTAGHLETLGMRLLYGRPIEDRDQAGTTNVVVVSRSYAERVWPGESAIGRRVNLFDRPHQVVGVVDDSKIRQVDEDFWYQIYYALEQTYSARVVLNVRVRSAGDRVVDELAESLSAAAPQLAFSRGRWSSWVDGSMWTSRVAGWLLSSLAIIALALSISGLYSTMSLWVTRRLPDLALRLALGASPRDLELLTLWRGFRLAAIGLSVGLPAAAVLSPLGESLIFGISPTEPTLYLIVGSLLLSVALLGALLPATRARKTRPMSVL